MKNIGLFAHIANERALRLVAYCADKFRASGATCYIDSHVAEALEDSKDGEHHSASYTACPLIDFPKYVDLVVSFGGDGTMLHVLRSLLHSDVPVLGVNVGKLGFLAEFGTEFLDRTVQEVMTGDYRVVDRSVLDITINGSKHFAINDCLIQRSGSRMIEVSAHVDSHFVANYRADGVIVTTPTGSTAYSLSCGGPVIAPNSAVLCITPIAPHTFTLRPLIVADSSDISLSVASEFPCSFVADGSESISLKAGDKLLVRKSSTVAKLIKRSDSTYFDLLRQKLLWSSSTVEKKEP